MTYPYIAFKMPYELSASRSFCILAIVVGCFAVLLPNIFFPMLKTSILGVYVDESNGCCDVLLYNDVNGVKLVSELCNSVLKISKNRDMSLNFVLYHLNKDAIKNCRDIVFNTCGVDIHNLLKDKILLNPVYKQTLEDMRIFNKSLCLKYHFDVTFDLLGAPHRIKKYNTSQSSTHYRQERSPYLQSNTLHPAFRERGRAVPQPHGMSKVQRERGNPPVPIISAQKPPIPGMRPPIGGAGHVPSQKGTGPMGILMPLYTIGIVIFFGYTIMKLICKKSENPANNLAHDPEFCRLVFNNNMSENKSCKNEKSNNFSTDTSSKLVVSAISSLLQEVNRDILERESNNVKDLDDILQPNENTNSCSKKLVELTDDQTSLNVELEKNKKSEDELSNINNSSEIVEQVSGVIEVIGMELNESCENGRPWKCSTQLEDGITPPPEITPQEIILPTNVPPNSQIFVSDAHTENVATQSSVILESKVTLNVISPELNNEIIDANELSNEDDVNEDDTKYENGVLKLESHQTNGNIKNNGTVSEESDEDEDIILRNGIKEFSKYEPDTSF